MKARLLASDTHLARSFGKKQPKTCKFYSYPAFVNMPSWLAGEGMGCRESSSVPCSTLPSVLPLLVLFISLLHLSSFGLYDLQGRDCLLPRHLTGTLCTSVLQMNNQGVPVKISRKMERRNELPYMISHYKSKYCKTTHHIRNGSAVCCLTQSHRCPVYVAK